MRRAEWARRIVFISLIFAFVSFAATAVVADDLSYERGNFKAILKAATSTVEKNYYDHN